MVRVGLLVFSLGLGLCATASEALAQARGKGPDELFGQVQPGPSPAAAPTSPKPQARPPVPPPPPPPSPAPEDGVGYGRGRSDNDLADWAVAVVAADWRSSRGQPIRAFENSRRDLSAAFDRAGFDEDNITALSLAPDATGAHLGSERAVAAIDDVAERATEGCLLYFTSHGSPAGIVWGPEGLMAPQAMDRLIDGWCGSRPTVVVVSACFSGVFVPVLAQPNRMIMTAARRDRSSFGCSEDATHPYFDGCVLEAMRTAQDFISLSMRATACVNRREREEGLTPPSEPQTYVGAEMQTLLPFLRFER